MIDGTDLAILRILQREARVSNTEIGRRIGLAPSAVLQRIRRLEERGVIQSYLTQCNTAALGYQLTAFVMIRTGEGSRAEEVSEGLAAIPEVLEVHRVVGDDCFFTKVRVSDANRLAALLDNDIRAVRGVATTRTTIVLASTKETFEVPLPVACPVPTNDSSSETASYERSVL